MKESFTNLVDLLSWRAQEQAQAHAYTFLRDGETEEARLTWGELDRRARAVGAWLQAAGARGERVLLLFPPGLEYVSAFFGCLYAGAVAVPVYPPRQNKSRARLQSILTDAQAAYTLTTTQILARIKAQLAEGGGKARPGGGRGALPRLKWLATDEFSDEGAARWRRPEVGAETLAFLQYTSGSTSAPKGVMVTHGNLLHNEALIQAAFRQGADSIVVGWLPLYHDMGLIGNVLQPLYVGGTCVLMSPVAFLQRPARWLEAISRYRATTSGGPDFAYDLCVRKISAAERRTLDLSSWAVAFDGAEPIRADTLDRFAEHFAPCGFRRQAFHPCYGLAEATLLVSGGQDAGGAVCKTVGARALERHSVVELPEDSEHSRRLVGCGQVPPGVRVLVVNPESLKECETGEVGEVWVAGESVARGYWNRPEETERTFNAHLNETGEGPFLRTGDFGFVERGELFVTGRLKDLIIIRGVNHYPQDIERTVEETTPDLRPGCGAAFAVEQGGAERLVVMHEVRQRREADLLETVFAIRQRLSEQHEVQPHAVVLVKTGSVPKTSSGKIQRHACRQAYLSKTLEVLAEWREGSDAAPVLAQELPALSAQADDGLETWLASVLASRLGVDVVAIDPAAPVIRYGLDSMGAVEFAHAIETRLGVAVPLAGLLQSTSVRSLAAQLRTQLAAGRTAASDAATASTEGADAYPLETCPLSRGQQALWFLKQLAPDSTAYNIATAVRVTPEVDVPRLRRAFQKLVDRHPPLRTTFAQTPDGPAQQISERVEVCFQEINASAVDAASLARRLVEEANCRFTLSQGPLLRVSLFTRAAGENLLLVVLHHIIADFWSLAVLVRELGELYAAEAEGREPALPPLQFQYTDYIRWQESLLASAEGERLQRYWLKQLEGSPSALNLLTDRPRPPVQTYAGASLAFSLDAELTARLRELSARQGATLYMTLLAAFQALLYRYTGQEDILVGTPTSGRRRPEWAGCVGYFVNTIVMRGRPSGGLTFADFLGQIRETALAAFEHQEYPFNLLVEHLQPERDPSRSPLFQVMFVLQKAHLRGEEGLAAFALGEEGARVELGGLTLESVALEQRVAQFDLTLMMVESGDTLSASLQYNTDLYEEATARRIARHLRALLEAAASDPSLRLSRLPLLDADERRQLLTEWGDGGPSSPDPPATLHSLFEAQARRTPDAVALVCGERRLSYSELDARADELALRLRRSGVGPESLVGVLLPRTSELVISLLGVLKAGGAYVPLDPAYPAERLRFMLADSEARVLVTQRELRARVEQMAGEAGGRRVAVLAVDDVGELAGEMATRAAMPDASGGGWPEPSPESAAYVIYTSGSTGRPKGVVIAHASASAFLRWSSGVFTSAEMAAVLASTSVCFDLSVFELFAPLCSGGSVVLAQDALELPSLPAAQSVTLVNTVPSAMSELARPGSLPASVRVVNLAGEPLQLSLVEAVYASPSVESVYNLYGPTEDTTYSTFCLVPRGGASEPDIGRPIAGTRAYVVDSNFEPAPAGVAGELYLGGAGLARGYLNRPALTAERFVPDPFGGEPGARLYRTGDAARWRPGGALEYLGRGDRQVKVRGFRIELGEVEAAACGCAGVREAAAAVEGEGAAARVVLYFATGGGQTEGGPAGRGDGAGAREGAGEDGAGVTAGGLRRELKRRLPEYMVPARWVRVASLPRLPNGKVDRGGLARAGAEAAGVSPSEGYVAARGGVEEALCEVWAEALGAERVGVRDNFFELGGHSLLAARLAARARELFGVELAVRAVFEAPTVAELAEVIESALKKEGPHVAPPPLVRASREGELPLSFAQQRLWFLDQLEPGSVVYNMPAAARLSGRLDASALQRGLNEIIRRHETLRTTFESIGGQPAQVIAPELRIELPLVDLRHLPADEAEEVARRLAQDEARRPFDLARGPLLRAQLLRLGEDEHVLLLTMHHIVSDGWSMGVLVRELASVYAAFADARPSPLAELPVQYVDFAAWQLRAMQGEALEQQLAYWREQLSGAPSLLEVPTDRPRPAVQSFQGATHAFRVEHELSASLSALGRREGATLFMTLLAGWYALLARYTGQTDIVVGVPVANRQRTETEGLIGFFVNTLALRTDAGGDPSFVELLARVKETCLGAYAHQELPFEKLVEELRPERNLSHAPLFQVMFIMQNAPQQKLELPGLSVDYLPTDSQTAKFDLTLCVTEDPEGQLNAALEYNTDLYEEATARRIARHLKTLLKAAADSPSLRLSRLPLLDADERRQLLTEWGDGGPSSPDPPATLHSLFEAQARRTPEAVALVCGGARLSYRELNERANQLAHYLRGVGVGPETLVGLMLERTPEMVVAVLGVLKAGGAYVPLDPTHPAERLGFVLEDARAGVLLTQGSLGEVLPPGGARVVDVEACAAELAGLPRENPSRVAGPDNLAYVIYTSGSTGRPKGVQIVHSAVVNFLHSMARRPGLSSGDVLAAVTTLSFDIAVLELLLPLSVGARVVLIERETATDGERLGERLREVGANVMQATPTTWRLLLQAGWRAGADFTILCGGEAWGRDLAAQLLPDGARVWNVYGPTETTIWSTLEEVAGGDAQITIGRPIDNTQLYILDASLEPAPVGVVGELYIGGGGLARGYFNRPALTAEKFIPDPFADEAGARLYRTGDVARYLPGGTVEYVGRADHQVKVRGFRIEPGEIESVLCEHPAVLEAAVVARDDAAGERQLVAYLTTQPGEAPSAAELRTHLNGRLPSYMVPASLVVLDALPLTPNGKVDRKALPAPDAATEASGETYLAPRTPLEEMVAGVYAEVLGVARVGAEDDFFELGGHSLLAARLAARARELFGVELAVRAVFEAPTVAELAEVIERERGAAVKVGAPRMVRLSREAYRVKLPAEGVAALPDALKKA